MDGEKMMGFGYKQAWLAVRDGEPGAVTTAPVTAAQVMAALGARPLGPADWRTGVDLAYLTDDRLVLTPTLPGQDGTRWLLVVGRWLLLRNSSVDVAALSEVLDTEVQYFATNRVIELHRWQRAIGGQLTRAFGHLGETGELLDWAGEPDGVEREAGLPAAWDGESDIVVGEEDVLRVASAWSLNPTTLDGQPAPGPVQVAAVSP